LNKNSPTLCILSANGFGDVLVQMVLANNLARCGYIVTIFSDIGASLNTLVDGYTILPFPQYSMLLDVLDSYNVVLYDSSGTYVRGMPKAVDKWCMANGICFRMSDAAPRHLAVTEQAIASRLPDNWRHEATTLKKLNATIRGQYFGIYRPPVVQQLVSHLNEKLWLTDVQTSNGLVNTKKKKDSKKVIVHPTSSRESKNWPAEKFLQLTRKLKSQGAKPVVTVSPAERDEWLNLVSGELEVPRFDSLESLALFYMDAGLFIGGDSGNAHLASCLGIPTIQLFKGWRKTPAWRAGWTEGKILVANFPYNLSKKSWAKGISVDRVLDTINGV
jgi:hypothetical protein